MHLFPGLSTPTAASSCDQLPPDYQHFEAAREDGAWLSYLEREALTYGAGPIPHEHERRPVIEAQVDEIRRRQGEGLIDPSLDPRLVRLLGFALASYPRLLPQITRMTTGTPPDDPHFIAQWETFIRSLGERLAIAETEQS